MRLQTDNPAGNLAADRFENPQGLNRMFLSMRVVCLLLMFACSTMVAEERRKPNVVLIMADDVGWEAFGCYGGEDYATPNIDRMARNGIRFSHCYSTPICTTSRVKIMTGKYNFRNYTHFGYLDPGEKTFGHLMKQNGYATAIAGKWQLNGLHNRLPGFDNSQRPIQAGFDEYMLWQLTTNRGKAYPTGGERFWNPVIETNGKFLTKQMNRGKYGPDMFCDFVCDFMERNADRPFFVYYPMVLVHDPFVPTPDTIGDADRNQANQAPRDNAGKKKNFVAMVSYMDKIVGRIIKKTEEIGQADNTLILFTADNGTNVRITSRWNGRDVQGGKAGLKDNGTHVPLVAYWKGTTPAGKVFDDLVDFTDFYATLSEAAGKEKPGADDPVDGRSFFQRLKGLPGQPREWVLCHYQPYWNKPPGQFIRNANYKLYRDGRFYSVATDLDEAHDLADSTNPEWSLIRSDFQRRLKQVPPVAPGRLNGKHEGERPVYPNWPNLMQRAELKLSDQRP